MNDLETLNDIAIEIKLVKQSMKSQEYIDELYSRVFALDESSRIIKLKIQITNLENRRKRIVRRMFNKYCT